MPSHKCSVLCHWGSQGSFSRALSRSGNRELFRHLCLFACSAHDPKLHFLREHLQNYNIQLFNASAESTPRVLHRMLASLKDLCQYFVIINWAISSNAGLKYCWHSSRCFANLDVLRLLGLGFSLTKADHFRISPHVLHRFSFHLQV